MRRMPHICGVVLFALALPAQLTAATLTWKNFVIDFETRMEPSDVGLPRLPGEVIPQPNDPYRVHRTITDDAHHREFAYDLVLVPADRESFFLRLEPPNIQPNPGVKLLAPPDYPVIMPALRAGDKLALDLLVNAATGQKIVDHLTIRSAAPAPAPESKAPRDFTIGDVNLGLGDPKVWVNGQPVKTKDCTGGFVSGHVLYLNLPGSGQWEFSLWPDPKAGLQKAGTVSDKTMLFHEGSSVYRLESTVDIAPGDGVYNLYVGHKPGPNDVCIFGAEYRAGATQLGR
jgi:hypothetical protein